jgi:hypothetical protein
LINRLDQISRSMNPFLAAVVIVLMVLDFACVVNLIDWRDPSETPVAAAGLSTSTAPATAPSRASSAASTVPGAPIATPRD